MSSTPETDARAARDAFERLLADDASGLAGLLPPGFADAAERFVRLLINANARLNLTRVVEPEDVARLHLLDSVAVLPVLDRLVAERAMDLGTGGGVPGIPLALARPGMAWTLVDSVRKKADAVRGFVTALDLPNVQVLAQRAEVLGRAPAQRESYDLVAARACASLPVLVEYALPLLRIGGSLLAWKGPVSRDELASGAAAAALLGGDAPSVLATGVAALSDHRFVTIRKQGPTPDRYPRRPGEPTRRPLAAQRGAMPTHRRPEAGDPPNE